MHAAVAVTPSQLKDVLLTVAVVRPVFIWGAPGIGKSALVAEFAAAVGLPCVSLLGSQLAPEDLIGVPQIVDGKSRFCPPTMIARDDPYVLFLDELNACSHEVQKAFYSLIHERRIGEYVLPTGSVVVGAGNRAKDAAIVKPLSSALINRLVHVHLRASTQDWFAWAGANGIHTWILEYLTQRPDHLWSEPPKTEDPFSTPRSWHMLSDALRSAGDDASADVVEVLARGTLTPHHATQFKAFVKQLRNKYGLDAILDGEAAWPKRPEDRDILYFLAQSFRARLIKELPAQRENLAERHKQLAHRGKALLKDLATISHEIAQLVVAEEEGAALPSWFLVDVVRDLPRLVEKKA